MQGSANLDNEVEKSSAAQEARGRPQGMALVTVQDYPEEGDRDRRCAGATLFDVAAALGPGELCIGQGRVQGHWRHRLDDVIVGGREILRFRAGQGEGPR